MRRTFAVGSGIALAAQAKEILSLDVKAAGAAALVGVLTPEAPCRDRNVEVDPDPVLRDLAVGRRHPEVPPVDARVSRAVLQHHPQRLAPFRVVRAARAPV